MKTARWRMLAARLLALGSRRRRDLELDEEIAQHLEWLAEEARARGASPEEAQLAARRRFGGVAHMKEIYREQGGFSSLEAFWQDMRFAARSLAKRPLLLVAAALSIAVGVGLNVGVYAALTRVLFGTSFSGAAPDERLVHIGGEMSFPNYDDLRKTEAFADIAAVQTSRIVWRAAAGTTRVDAKIVSTNFFDLVGVKAAYGRTFHGQDDVHTAVLGFGFWERRFAADPSVIGQVLNLNGWPYVIIGILPKTFNAPVAPMLAPSVYVPISPQVSVALSNRAAAQFDLLARLRDGVDVAQAGAALTTAATELERRYPRANARFGRSLSLQPTTGIGFWRGMAGGGFSLLITAATTVYAIVGLVLFVACANVAGLLLARAEERRREIAVCAALGATRWRLAQRFVAESAIIALVGCLLAAALYEAAIAVISNMAWAAGGVNVTPPALPLIYCGALVVVVTLACAIGPAFSVSRTAPGPALAVGRAAAGRRRAAGRNVLVVTQVAICFVLLSGGSVLFHGLLRLRSVDPGFDVAHTISVNVRMPPETAGEPGARPFERIRAVVSRLPGVESVSSARNLPLMFLTWRASVHTETAVDTHLAVDIYPVGPRYLETMRVPLLRGRDLADTDLGPDRSAGTPIVVNETLARRYFGGLEPTGRRLVLERHGGEGPDQLLEVVGVARDSKLRSLNEDSHPALFLPEVGSNFFVRVAGPASGAVRTVEQAIADSEAAASVEASPMSAQVAFALLPTRIGSSVLAALGGIGLLMAIVGLYAIVTYTVNRRTFEIGVRLALGASRAGVLRMILREGLTVVAIGCAIGGVLSFLLTRVLAPLLAVGQDAFDPLALIAVVVAMGVVGAAASLAPARRAARVDPCVALRSE